MVFKLKIEAEGVNWVGDPRGAEPLSCNGNKHDYLHGNEESDFSIKDDVWKGDKENQRIHLCDKALVVNIRLFLMLLLREKNHWSIASGTKIPFLLKIRYGGCGATGYDSSTWARSQFPFTF